MRHTFAVRRYLETRDIYQVCKELGHTSVTTTERYAKFNIYRLEQEFPSLVSSKVNNKVEKGSLETPKGETQSYLKANHRLLN